VIVMSNRNKYQMIVVIHFALSLLACNSGSYAQQQISMPQSLQRSALHAEILKYKTWTVVNAEPVKQDLFASADCADVRTPVPSPHKDKYIRVYVNDVGQEAMLEAKSPKFPVGTIVIKEKLPEKKSQTPEFFTIMLKREAGYDPRGGDWQYLIMRSAKAKIETPSDIESCQSCHSAWAEKSDFISRTYLSTQQHQKMR
jgi:hypothetical protein